MLPTSYFERITSTFRVKTFTGSRERRRGLRIDVRMKALLFPIQDGVLTAPQQVKIREMSPTGASLISQSRIRSGQEFLLRIAGKDGNTYWIWCRCRRCSHLDNLAAIVGLNFCRILGPGQQPHIGCVMEPTLWHNVEGTVVPEDPYGRESRAA